MEERESYEIDQKAKYETVEDMYNYMGKNLEKSGVKVMDKCDYCEKKLGKNKQGDSDSIYLEFGEKLSKEFCSNYCLRSWIIDNKKALDNDEEGDIFLLFSEGLRQEFFDLLEK
jgi:hypothetical protein